MIDLSAIPADVLRARGEYSTVRAAHEDEKKNLQMLCGLLSSTSAQILRRLQPDNDGIPDSVSELLASGRQTLQMMEDAATRIESLAKQRQELKAKAWSKS
jgi:hypothetical protein